MDGNFMKIRNQPKPGSGRRWVSILMMISLLVGSVSIASFAKGTDKPERGWRIGINVSKQQTKNRVGRTGTATPSELSAPATASNATASNMAVVNYTLGELLEQSDTSGAITAEWFQVKLDDTIISNSNDYRLKLKSGTKIRPDAIVEHRMKVTLQPQQGELGEGDTVTWNLGRIEGLNLPPLPKEEAWEEMTLDGIDFGCACLRYEEDGTLYLTMEFYDEIQEFPWINVTYWYESTFIPVAEKTNLWFDLPGYENPEYAVLLPAKPDETSTGTIEPTVPEPTKPEETTPPESSPEETTGVETTEETTAEETTVPEPTTGSSKRKSSGSGSSSVSSVSATTAAETTVAAATEEPTTAENIEQESTVQTQEPTQEASPESSPEKNETADRDGGSGNMADKTVKDAVEQITGQQQENILKLDIVEMAGGHSRMQPGELIVYRMAVRNVGTEIVKDIRVRDYLPDYTSFVSVEDGSYGVINGRQHVTWMLDQLNPGEEKELVLSVRVFKCIPENHRIENQVYWQADNKAQTNDPENPSEVKSLPAIIIG